MSEDEKKEEGPELVLPEEVSRDASMREAPAQAEDGFLVRLVIRATPQEVRAFGPFATPDEAYEIAEAIRGGMLQINFTLMPEAFETIVVEPVKLPESERN